MLAVKLFIIFVSLLLAGAGWAWAADLYVDPSSVACTTYSALRRDCTGSDGAIYRTIQAALDKAQPGDTVFLRAGRYHEVVTLKIGGEPDRPLTVRNFPGEIVIITGNKTLPAQPQGLITLGAQRFIVLTGLTLTNSRYYGILAQDAQNIVISQCEVAHSEHGGVVFENSSKVLIDGGAIHHNNELGQEAWHEAVSFDNTADFVIRNSRVYDNREEAIDAKYGSHAGLILNNDVARNNNVGIYIDAAYDITIANNRVFGSSRHRPGVSIAVEHEWNRNKHSAHHIRLVNNLIYDNGAGFTFWIESGAEGYARLHDILIAHNVFYNNNKNNWGALFLINGGADNYGEDNFIVNNIFWDNTRNLGAHTLLGARALWDRFTIRNNVFRNGEPSVTHGFNPVFAETIGFRNELARDFRLRPDSPAIDVGAPVSAVIDDFAGNPRPQGAAPDSGAFEAPPH